LLNTYSVSNNPDIFSPSGSQTTTIDPITGKSTITQKLNPEYEALRQALVKEAGTPRDSYKKPDNYDAIHGSLINRREDFLGLPQSEFVPREQHQRQPVDFSFVDDEDSEDD
jgi:hypothetical protein